MRNKLYFQYIDNEGNDYCMTFRSEESLEQHIEKHSITKVLYRSNKPFPFRPYKDMYKRIGAAIGFVQRDERDISDYAIR